jgi:hypothetical protein
MARPHPPPRTCDDLQAGDTFALRLPDGRCGACRVLRAGTDEYTGKQALVAALAWLGSAPPPLTEPRLRLLQRRTVNNSAGKPNLFWVRGAKLPETLTYLGVLPPSEAEKVLGSGVGYSDWEPFIRWVAAQWQHEEAQGLPPADSEAELRRRARVAARAHAAERRRKGLARLSKDPFPPDKEGFEEENAAAYRQILGETLATLQELGPEGDEVARLDALRQCVEHFNTFEEYIDTSLREWICEFFADLVWVAGLEDYGEDLNCPWRDF